MNISTQEDQYAAVLDRLKQFDSSSDYLFPKLVDAARVTIDRETAQIVRDRTGSTFLGIAIPDLLFRLECQQIRERRLSAPQDSEARARIWRHVAEALKSGEQIPDITNEWQLNAWLPEDAPKFYRPPIQRNCGAIAVTVSKPRKKRAPNQSYLQRVKDGVRPPISASNPC